MRSPYLTPDFVIFRAMPRRGMHDPGALIDSNVIGEDAEGLLIQEGMTAPLPLHDLSLKEPRIRGAFQPNFSPTCANKALANRKTSPFYLNWPHNRTRDERLLPDWQGESTE